MAKEEILGGFMDNGWQCVKRSRGLSAGFVRVDDTLCGNGHWGGFMGNGWQCVKQSCDLVAETVQIDYVGLATTKATQPKWYACV